MHSRESSRLTAPLAHRVAEDADADHIATAILALWTDIEAALQPIVGRRGVAALFKRALHLTTAQHPWLAPLKPGQEDAVDMAHLRQLVAEQAPAQAGAAGSALFENFRELLTALIGTPLSERLLQAVWSNSSSAAPAQDPTP
ncbi:hypothetical protein [Roseateles sp. LYH14W]|uniref:DUF2267 domain-containing protein n=1 Tax=Pelomonas parva TaxID=3299032 RepID=A0ABW7F1Y2_9BURK